MHQVSTCHYWLVELLYLYDVTCITSRETKNYRLACRTSAFIYVTCITSRETMEVFWSVLVVEIICRTTVSILVKIACKLNHYKTFGLF